MDSEASDPQRQRPEDPSGRRPLAEVWAIAWPTVLTMASYTFMQFVDGLMVGQIGPLELAAQGNASIWVYVPLMVGMGALTVVNTFVSQNLGAGTPRRGPGYAWAGFWLSAAMWACFLLPLAALAPFLFNWLHVPGSVAERDQLVELEIGYARILLVGGLFTLGSRAFYHFFFGLHRPKIITAVALLANAVNGLANYTFIFGENGIPALGLPGVPGVPALGLYGAALGTVLGTLVEFAVPAGVFLGRRLHRELGTRDAWRPPRAVYRDLLRVGWPAGLPQGNNLACWAIFMTIIIGQFGENHMTAGWIGMRYMSLSFMPAVGFSVAVNSLVARYIGAGHPDVAVSRARLGLAMAVAYMVACGLVFIALRHPLVAAFVGGDATPASAAQIIAIGGQVMICIAVFQALDGVQILYAGALRGAGDTLWPGLVSVAYSWLILVGGGLLLGYAFPEWGSVGPWIGAALHIGVLSATLARRFESGHWRTIDLLSGARPQPAVAPVSPVPEPGVAVGDLSAEIAAELPAARAPLREEP